MAELRRRRRIVNRLRGNVIVLDGRLHMSAAPKRKSRLFGEPEPGVSVSKVRPDPSILANRWPTVTSCRLESVTPLTRATDLGPRRSGFGTAHAFGLGGLPVWAHRYHHAFVRHVAGLYWGPVVFLHRGYRISRRR
jgi:hypothetical protein